MKDALGLPIRYASDAPPTGAALKVCAGCPPDRRGRLAAHRQATAKLGLSSIATFRAAISSDFSGRSNRRPGYGPTIQNP